MRAVVQRVTQARVTLAGEVVAIGRFGADMAVSLTNAGPVTIWMDTATR